MQIKNPVMENLPCLSVLQIHTKVWIDTGQKYKLVLKVIEAVKISGNNDDDGDDDDKQRAKKIA